MFDTIRRKVWILTGLMMVIIMIAWILTLRWQVEGMEGKDSGLKKIFGSITGDESLQNDLEKMREGFKNLGNISSTSATSTNSTSTETGADDENNEENKE